jgi:hypothetical protein
MPAVMRWFLIVLVLVLGWVGIFLAGGSTSIRPKDCSLPQDYSKSGGCIEYTPDGRVIGGQSWLTW